MTHEEMFAGLAFDSRSQLWHRPGTYDLSTIHRERPAYRPLELGPGEVVLDLGGHLGSFVDLAIRAGCNAIVTVEPAPDNWRVLMANYHQHYETWKGKVVFHRAAVARYAATAVPPKTTGLYLNTGTSHGTHSIVPRRGRRDVVEVALLNYDELLSELQPTTIKMDVEGSEFNLLFPQPQLPSSVRKIAVEIHRTRKAWREWAEQVSPALQAEGFRTVVGPRRVGRATVGVWAR